MAAKWSAADGEAFVDRLWLHALGRRPRPRELAIALEAMREANGIEGKKDVLWMVLMLPEFQLIH